MIKFQSGGYLVLVSLLMVVLISIGALALDLGRMFVVRSEIQNAVDTAALAAAAELDATAGAITRAGDVARGLLSHQSAFTQQADLLDALTIEFYSALGEPPGSAREPASGDNDARFARVIVDQASVGLLFLPVLNVALDAVSDQATLSAAATAGRPEPSQICGAAPVMLCIADSGINLPLGGSGFNAGSQVQLPIRAGGAGSTSGSGNWGIILPADIQPGNQNDVAAYLNNPEDPAFCVNEESPEFQTVPGSAPNLVDDFNAFFGVDSDSPAYPRDSVATGNDHGSILLGSGDWTESDFSNVNGALVEGESIDSFATRMEAHEALRGDAGNRLFTIPVIQDSCGGLNGKTTFIPEEPEGFATFFLTEPIDPSGNSGGGPPGGGPPGGGPPGGGPGGSASQPPQIMAEFIAWGAGGAATGGGATGSVILYE